MDIGHQVEYAKKSGRLRVVSLRVDMFRMHINVYLCSLHRNMPTLCRDALLAVSNDTIGTAFFFQMK